MADSLDSARPSGHTVLQQLHTKICRPVTQVLLENGHYTDACVTNTSQQYSTVYDTNTVSNKQQTHVNKTQT